MWAGDSATGWQLHMFVNAHTHLYSGLVPFGMPTPSPRPTAFVEILRQVWWRLDRALDERALRAAARYYVADARRRGTAVIVDHHESPSFIEGSLDVLADACAEFGVHALLCYGATERNGGEREARRGLAECRRFILGTRRPGIGGAVGLHASFTVSDGTIRAAGALCRELGAVLHVHLAEAMADVEDARCRGYEGPFERLMRLDALPAGSILAHGVHLSRDQARAAGDAGCWLVQNPRSNRNNGVGYPGALRGTARVGLGTDGFASDMLEEARTLAAIATTEGDLPDPSPERLAAGWDLARESLGLEPPGPRAAEDAPAFDFAAIEAEARAEAERLWRRW